MKTQEQYDSAAPITTYLRSTLEGNACVDIDECLENTHGCDHECVNRMRGYDCVCNFGYRLSSDGRGCKDVDECADAALNECGNAHGCQNLMGSYACACNSGWV